MGRREYFEKIFFHASGGRTPEEELQYIDQYGSHGVPDTLRSFLLMDMGLPEPADQAENIIVLGCYPPFMDRDRIKSYFALLDALEINHTYLEREYCCGVPLLRGMTKDSNPEQILAQCAGFVDKNKAAADRKGARTLAYYCVGCAHAVKLLDRQEPDRHIYALDLIVSALNTRKLKLPPTKAAYFEGCHTRYEALQKNVSLNWEQYRLMLDAVEGLEIIDLPNKVCCTKKPDYIVDLARKADADILICSCCGCSGSLGMSAGDDIRVAYLPDILLEALQK